MWSCNFSLLFIENKLNINKNNIIKIIIHILPEILENELYINELSIESTQGKNKDIKLKNIQNNIIFQDVLKFKLLSLKIFKR